MIDPDGRRDDGSNQNTFTTTVIIVVTAILVTGLLWLLIDSNPFGPHGP